VTNARWDSTYDLHATTDSAGKPSKQVSLNYRARICQTTGEDWTDTALVLSTANSDTLTRGVPTLAKLRITPFPVFIPNQAKSSGGLFGTTAVPQYGQPKQQMASFGAFGTSAHPQAPAAFSFAPVPGPGHVSDSIHRSITPGSQSEDEFVEAPAPGPMREPATVVKESPLSLTYTVEGKASVPTDGLAHQVSVASLPFEGTASYVVVPRAETVAYLEVSVSPTNYPAWSWSIDVCFSAP
jgi:hypothetical protein